MLDRAGRVPWGPVRQVQLPELSPAEEDAATLYNHVLARWGDQSSPLSISPHRSRFATHTGYPELRFSGMESWSIR